MEFTKTLPESGGIKNRIVNYWTQRSHDFAELREKEQHSAVGLAWLAEIERALPAGGPLKLLDIGCGTGIFSLMLSEKGHDVTGIDLTEHMILHARELANRQHSAAKFLCMDAEQPEFPDNTFDAVITRNLTWTLPHVEEAYAQWFRILKPGGLLLNFDADYGHDRFDRDASELPPQHVHRFLSKDLTSECESIKAQLTISDRPRPGWDLALLRDIGYTDTAADTSISRRIYRKIDPFYNPTPMFFLRARKPN